MFISKAKENQQSNVGNKMLKKEATKGKFNLTISWADKKIIKIKIHVSNLKIT